MFGDKNLPIRKITLDDVESLEELDRQCFSDTIRFNRHALWHYLSLPNSIGYLYSLNDDLLGFVIATELPEQTYNIVTIDVEPNMLRRGIGTELIQMLITILKNRNAKGISLQVSVNNDPAIKFYLKHGFRIVETLASYYPTEDGYQMEYEF
jgi:ribosomal protein S18 acetylase RimI-like enzyme